MDFVTGDVLMAQDWTVTERFVFPDFTFESPMIESDLKPI